MKTTVEISDTLLAEARAVAAREGVTLRGLIERGLHRIVHEAAIGPPFKLRRASFRGNGRQPEFEDACWEQIRDAIYQGRGV
jgi:antitoxin component of RelBE/YafQ-DinJ toxin-antitoxin module